MFSLAWPWLLVVLPIPIAIYMLIPPAKSNQAALRVPFYDSISGMGQELFQSTSILKMICMTLVWCLLVFAAARPQWVGEATFIPVNGRDLMLAVDVSGSMKAEDMVQKGKTEDRLTAVKRVAKSFIQNRVGDRIGLILFGTRAYLQAPLSFDRKTVNTLLQESAIGIAGEKTAIGDAVGIAIKRLQEHYADREGLKEDKEIEKVLILLTDGANTAGSIEPIKAAELARAAKLKIYTIGVGADELLINDIFGQRVVRPSADLDEDTLTTMADLTGGQYFRAQDVDSLNQIYDLIDKLEPIEEDSKLLRPTIELFYLPLGLAAFLSALFGIIFGKFFTIQFRPGWLTQRQVAAGNL